MEGMLADEPTGTAERQRLIRGLLADADRARRARAPAREAGASCVGSVAYVELPTGEQRTCVMVRIDAELTIDDEPWLTVCGATRGTSWDLHEIHLKEQPPAGAEINPTCSRIWELVDAAGESGLTDKQLAAIARDPLRLLTHGAHGAWASEAEDGALAPAGNEDIPLFDALEEAYGALGGADPPFANGTLERARATAAPRSGKQAGRRARCVLLLGGGPATAGPALDWLGAEDVALVVVENESTPLGRACKAIGTARYGDRVTYVNNWDSVSTKAKVKQLGLPHGGISVALASPPCESFSDMSSLSGTRTGFAPRGASGHCARDDWLQILRIMRWCRELWPACELALENVEMSSKHRLQATKLVRGLLDCEQCLDAARGDGAGRRVRMLLTSKPFAPALLVKADDPFRRTFQKCCLNGALPLAAASEHGPPLVATCMYGGSTRKLLGPQISPAAMARITERGGWNVGNGELLVVGSREQGGVPGGGYQLTAEGARSARQLNLVFDPTIRRVRSLYIGELEQLLGLPVGYTCAPGVTATMRRLVLKNMMDVGCTAYMLSELMTDRAAT